MFIYMYFVSGMHTKRDFHTTQVKVALRLHVDVGPTGTVIFNYKSGYFAGDAMHPSSQQASFNGIFCMILFAEKKEDLLAWLIVHFFPTIEN